MNSTSDDRTPDATDRLIRSEDLVPCSLAFIDCKIPGSQGKINYSIIGAGVTQSDEQFVNLAEPHGFALGVAAMPHGVTNNLHFHYTAEVFQVFRGKWLFRWGSEGKDGEIVGEPGDILSMPTWVFRGFTNIGPDDSWIFTMLGQDESGGVVWHPDILDQAASEGLYLTKSNMLVDTTQGHPKPAADDLIRPVSRDEMAVLPRYSQQEMLRRLVRFADLDWSESALLDHAMQGHASALAPVIGLGLSEDRNANAPIMNAHGFSLSWLRIAPGNLVGPFRINEKQVLIVKEGAVEITLGSGREASRAVAEPWSTFSVPAGVWRTLRSVGDAPALMTITTQGDGRPQIEWDSDIVEQAAAAGIARDPNGYIAPLALLPQAG